jgi:hypothetical protein
MSEEVLVADNALKAEYYYARVPDRPGEGVKVLAAIKKAGINLIAFSGFPDKEGTAQLDLVVQDGAALREAAARAGFPIVGPRTCFLIDGDDRAGAIADTLARLAPAGVSVTALDAVRVGARFAALLFVKPEDVARTSQALGATEAATRAA